MKQVYFIAAMLLSINGIAQSVVVSDTYMCWNGYTVSIGDTVYLNTPHNGDTYKSIVKEVIGKDKHLSSSDGVSYVVVSKIEKFYPSSNKEYAKIQVNGDGIKKYTLFIDDAVKLQEIKMPNDFEFNKKTFNDRYAYTATNNITYSLGDNIVLGNGSLLNGDFRHLSKGGITGIINSSESNTSSDRNISGKYAGTKVTIKTINYYGLRSKVYFLVDGVDFKGYALSIEEAISSCEVTPCKASTTSGVSVADELIKLHGLMKQGIITEAEYEQQKDKLLSK